MRIENYFIGITVFGLFIFIGFSLFLEQSNNYGLDVDSGIFDGTLLNITGDMHDTVIDTNSKTQGRTTTDEDTDSVVYKDSYPAALTIGQGAEVFGRSIEIIERDTGLIPPKVTLTFKIILLILVAAFLLYIIRGFKPMND